MSLIQLLRGRFCPRAYIIGAAVGYVNRPQKRSAARGARGHAALIQRDGEELKPVCLIRAANSLAWRGGRVNGLALPRRDGLRPS
jgi:hypothetical protein